MNRKKILLGIKTGTILLAVLLLAAFISGRTAKGTADSLPQTTEEQEADGSGMVAAEAQGEGQNRNMDGAYDSVFGKAAGEWYTVSMPVLWNAENGVIYEEQNTFYGEGDSVYLTEDHVLHGTGRHADVYMEEVRFARVYGEQIIVLKQDGSVWCRGSVRCLSDQRTLEYPDWKFVCPDAVYASLGHNLYMAVTKDGSLYLWGDNTLGQFGDGSLLEEKTDFDPEKTFYTEPVKVADHVKMVWQGVPGKQYPEGDGRLRTWILTQEDRLYVCGEAVGTEAKTFEWYGELGDRTDGLEIVCTSQLSEVKRKGFGTDYGVRENPYAAECEIKSRNRYEIRDGILYGSGRNDCGQLGLGYVDDPEAEYEEVEIAKRVKHVDFNGSSLIFLTEENELYGVGASQRGQLGQEIVRNNLTECEENCVTAPRLIMKDVRFAALGGSHLLILTTDGTLWALGDNVSGQLGILKERTRNWSSPDSWTAQPVQVMDHVKAIAASAFNSAAVTADGTLYLWGDNSYGQIGNGKSGNGFPSDSDCVSTLPEAILKNKVTEFHFSFSEEGRTRSLAYSAVEDKTYEW